MEGFAKISFFVFGKCYWVNLKLRFVGMKLIEVGDGFAKIILSKNVFKKMF